jgi:tryptophan-rich sensory protein
MPYATALIPFTQQQERPRMLQFDFTLLFIWYAAPFALLGLQAALAGYRAWKKRTELRQIEKKITPFSREL